ncbi:substrate-binding periplasmic protein [Cryobacterium psychrophilum]|uniref:Amino acid ABC transporter substrate-binding protein n=1 Tax=Cryobacterium psychrophilum TaxID=41988 RepID=A0A4Y8KK58_9MICO|nr:transporter substrate-binding domain-containing protein [Cryobacterium psychrophilum]TDW30866.1 amino acid ABC transporter substrate-binding protein (PAAT family) [Cryobacterium psychrophilum]TFD75745.1 amino acid ABC transporter substrate-binding protein [Cryobacterium psychrophilum]
MNNLGRSFAGVALVTGLVATLAACSAAEPTNVADDCTPDYVFSTIESGTLTVGLTEIPPFSYTDNGDATGVDVDIVSAFADANCLTVDYVPVTYSAAVPAVESKRIDLTIGDWYRTAARSEIVNFTAPNYLDEFSVISETGITTVEGLVGQKVGTVEGYLWVDDLRTLLDSDLQVYPSSVELKQDIEAGRINVGVDAFGTSLYNFGDTDYQVTTVAPDERVLATVEAAQTGFPYTQDNTDMGIALDATIEDLHASGGMVDILEAHGLPASAEKVGEPRLIE